MILSFFRLTLLLGLGPTAIITIRVCVRVEKTLSPIIQVPFKFRDKKVLEPLYYTYQYTYFSFISIASGCWGKYTTHLLANAQKTNKHNRHIYYPMHKTKLKHTDSQNKNTTDTFRMKNKNESSKIL